MSDAERDEFEFEPIEDLTDAETPGDELAEPLAPLDDAELADALEPAEDAEMAEGFQDEAAFPAGEALAEAGVAAEGEAEEEDAGEEEEEGEDKPEEKKKKKGRLLASIREASPYTVMLIVAFVALLLGTLCLVGELARYDGDIKAEKAKRGSAMATVPYSPADSSTLAACPTCEKLDFSTNGDVA